MEENDEETGNEMKRITDVIIYESNRKGVGKKHGKEYSIPLDFYRFLPSPLFWDQDLSNYYIEILNRSSCDHSGKDLVPSSNWTEGIKKLYIEQCRQNYDNLDWRFRNRGEFWV